MRGFDIDLQDVTDCGLTSLQATRLAAVVHEGGALARHHMMPASAMTDRAQILLASDIRTF